MQMQRIATNGIYLNVAVAGPPAGSPVILLHGFPKFWYGWRRQIAVLAAAGFAVWAPDQRGYNLSDKPQAVSEYSLPELARDVIGLLAAASLDRAAVVGHDWGGGVAWHLATHFPDTVRRLVILNAPHPSVMRTYIRRSLKQLMRSWYMAFFQVPRLPEWTARRGNWKATVDSLRATSRPEAFDTADFDRYRQTWSRPGAFRSMLNWYRAAGRARGRSSGNDRIDMPTLLLWGAQNRFLPRELAGASQAVCNHGRLVVFEEATHWLHHEEPRRVNELILEFLGPPDAGPS